MRRYFSFVFFIVLMFFIVTCKQSNTKSTNTIVEGETTVLVDESIKPVVEDLVQVFESKYNTKITIVAKSETEVIQALAKDTSRIAILTRTITKDEITYFNSKKLYPRITPFAKDAIAFITNKNTKDTLITLKELTDFMKATKTSKIKGLVFDNLNSSTVRYISDLSGIKNLPSENVFSFKTNNEVIDYVAQNNGMIGVIGINYIFEPSEKMKESIQKINILNVLNTADNKYYSPTQNNLAEGTYPLARDLFVVNAQGNDGLGMRFSAFITSEIGQRIILKSGLLPCNIPSRKIRIRNTINNDKK
jgi:phosphate transport system substrate-binding protein